VLMRQAPTTPTCAPQATRGTGAGLYTLEPTQETQSRVPHPTACNLLLPHSPPTWSQSLQTSCPPKDASPRAGMCRPRWRACGHGRGGPKSGD
jgi:hypothetical protein